ncbi:hypothetical protein D3C87_2167640 [compost metagenome]
MPAPAFDGDMHLSGLTAGCNGIICPCYQGNPCRMLPDRFRLQRLNHRFGISGNHVGAASSLGI